jgi:hypothetical protein
LAGILFGVGQTLISCTFAAIFFAGACLIRADLTTVPDVYTAMFAVMFAGVQAGGNLYFLSQLSAAKIGACIYFERIVHNNENESYFQVEEETSSDIPDC